MTDEQNVYELEYEQKFIDQLPINFNKMKSLDLTTIPKRYHRLFTTDWNWGKYSSMKMYDRMDLHQLFLEYQRNKFKDDN